MNTLPTNPSRSTILRNPALYPVHAPRNDSDTPDGVQTPPKPSKPVLNALEARYRDVLVAMKFRPLEQSITLRLDPPYKSYRPDLAYIGVDGGLVFVETKGKHRFREKGIAKVALAAKTYPMFTFMLVEWDDPDWKITPLSP